MVTTNQLNYDIILDEAIKFFKKEGLLFISSQQYADEIDIGKGTIEANRAQGRGIQYVQFGNRKNSHIRYRIDHYIAQKYRVEHNLTVQECKKLIEQVLKSKYALASFNREQVAYLYGFKTITLDRHLDKLKELKEAEKKGYKVEYQNLVAPKHNRESDIKKARYQFYLENIVEHICETLVYTKSA